MRNILFERHRFKRDASETGGRVVKVLLHIDHEGQCLTIGEPFDAFRHVEMGNKGRDILAGPFEGGVDEVGAFVEVYREALEFGKKRLSEVRETLPQP